ncbi:hypothetical protein, partial [Paracoccus sp. (in: a-proteobacteria)]|uniref:hypothetical protein n=1 Tax=Paracoccus sp. TaxID=267 RepID=UPI00396CD31B
MTAPFSKDCFASDMVIAGTAIADPKDGRTSASLGQGWRLLSDYFACHSTRDLPTEAASPETAIRHWQGEEELFIPFTKLLRHEHHGHRLAEQPIRCMGRKVSADENLVSRHERQA